MDRRLMLFVAPLLLGVAGCGPRPQELGIAVLASAPIVHAITAAVLWGLCLAWRRREPQLHFPWRTHVGIVAALAVLGLASGLEMDAGLVLVALWIFGTAYLAVTVLVWRIAFAFRRDSRAFLLSSAAAIAICVTPAIAMSTGMFEHDPNSADWLVCLWMFGGCAGIVPAVLLIPCAIEAWWRGRRQL